MRAVAVVVAVVVVVTLAVALARATSAHAQPARVEDVVASAITHHPLVEAARTAVERADGQVVAANGAFDPRVRLRATDVITGYYDHTLVDGELRMPTPVQGIVPVIGWRLGRGELPDYDRKLSTLALGELRAGLEIPLLQGGRIDRARGDVRKAALARDVASAEVRQRILDVQRDGAIAYVDWVAAGHRLAVRQRQLALANDRARQLDQAVGRGSRAPLDLVDNVRLVATREALVVTARLGLRRASLDLSLYLRDAQGAPIVVAPEPLPPLAAPPPTALERDLASAVRLAAERAPRLAELARRLEIAETDLAVARNATLPRLDVAAYAARGLGDPDPALPDRSELAVAVGATFELPIGMRTARGAVAVAAADRRRLAAERRFVADRITAEVAGAQAELEAARRRAELAVRGAELAEQVAAAERTRFERGDSNLLLVNLREEAAADAAALAVDARAEVWRARTRFLALLGDDATSSR